MGAARPRGQAERVPHVALQDDPARRGAPLPRQADDRPRDAQVVVSLPRAGRRGPYGYDVRRADAEGPPHGRSARGGRHGQPQGGPEAAGARLDPDHGDVYADWDIDQLAQTMADVLMQEGE